MYRKFSLSEQENLEVLENIINGGEKRLHVFLLTSKHYNNETFKQTMRKIWHPVKKMVFINLGPRLLLAKCEDSIEKERIKREVL